MKTASSNGQRYFFKKLMGLHLTTVIIRIALFGNEIAPPSGARLLLRGKEVLLAPASHRRRTIKGRNGQTFSAHRYRVNYIISSNICQ